MHYLKTLDRGVGCLHRFEAAHRFDQLFQLAVVGLDDVIQKFDLTMLDIFWARPFFLQLANFLAVAAGFIGVDLRYFFQIFSDF